MGKQYQLFFVQKFKGKVLFSVPMAEYTSLRIGGPADVMAFPQDEADLKDLLVFANSKNFPVFILGNGTNLLVRDKGIRGIVINMSDGFGDVEFDGDKAAAGAGVKLPALVARAREAGLSGLEFAAGIPGTIGGAVVMNAGAYGGEMKDVVEGVDVVSPRGKKGYLSNSDLAFSYRRSALPQGSVVVRAHLKLKQKDRAAIDSTIEEIRKKREKTSAIKYPNAGSVFKNPENESAGRLIEEAGLKGHMSGGAAISDVHANYLVNLGGARARDVLNLMATARDKVFKSRGIVLEPELKVVGED